MPKTKGNQLKNAAVCALCKSSEDDELCLGKFFHSKDLSVHNFCMLFSSDLSQNGKNDNDGFAGFLLKDIKKEVIRGRRLKCSYCKRNGATIGCCVPACKKVFHLNCGLKQNSLHLFYDSFLSYCCAHKAKPIYPEGEKLSSEYSCSICCDTVYVKDYNTTIWASCCKNGWFHKPCIQRQAHNSGYFFRCPLCNNTEQFQKQMLHHGIYIPQQDAAWELEENAFQDLLFRHEQCDASSCLCPKGRKYQTKTSQWRLILCADCGSQGRHIGCDDSITPKGIWKCQSCIDVNERMKTKKEKLDKKLKELQTVVKLETLQESSRVRTLRSASRKNSTGSTVLKGEIIPSSEGSSLIKDEIIPISDGFPPTKDEILPTSDGPSSAKDEILPTFDGPSSTTDEILPTSDRSPSTKDEILLVPEGSPFIKDEISSVSEQKCEGASSSPSHYSDVLSHNESTYKITIISKRGEEDLSKNISGNSAPLIHPEIKEFLDIGLEPKQGEEDHNLEHENAIDLFSDVVASVPDSDLDFFPYKSEISCGDAIALSKQFPNSSLNCDPFDECKEAVSAIFMGNNSASHLHDNKSVNLEHEVPKILSIQNELCLPQLYSSIIEAESDNVTTAASGNADFENFLSQSITSMGNLCNTKMEKELKEVSAVKDDLPDFSFSPDTVKNTYKIHRKHSKRTCADVEDSLQKKQKRNHHFGQSCSSIVILNMVKDMNKTIEIGHKCFGNPSSKTVNEILSPTLSSESVEYSQDMDNEEHSNEAFDVENILANNKAPVVMKVHGSMGHNGERDHREPLVKLVTVRNRLAKKREKTRHAEGNCETSHNSAHSSDSHHISENKSVKKQKLHMLSKKNYTSVQYKDNYKCIKALLGGPGKCCENKITKDPNDSSTKSKSSKKCSQNCRPQYNIKCIGKRLENVSLGSKHTCKRPTNYIVNFWQPGRQISTISETKEKLSVKPEVIHLKTVPH